MKPGFIYKHNFSDTDKNKFIDTLRQSGWNQCITGNTETLSDNSYGLFVDKLVSIFNDCFPITRHKKPQKNVQKKPHWRQLVYWDAVSKKRKTMKDFKKSHLADSDKNIKYMEINIISWLKLLKEIIIRINSCARPQILRKLGKLSRQS